MIIRRQALEGGWKRTLRSGYYRCCVLYGDAVQELFTLPTGERNMAWYKCALAI